MSEIGLKSYTGSPVRRREDARLLLGQACFIDDVPEPAGTLHIAFLRSPHAHAKIVSIDSSEALKVPGVVAVFTGQEIAAKMKPIASPTLAGQPQLLRPGLAVDVVRYVGEAVAAVVAESAYAAEDGLEAIQVDFDPLPAILSVEQGMAEGAVLVHDYLPSNEVYRLVNSTPGTDDAFERATHVEHGRFSSERVSAVAMETRGFLSSYDRGINTLRHYASAQLPHKMRWDLAEALHIPERSVQVIAPQVGGSFGMKGPTYSEDFVGAILARELGRPVKWIQDRQEDSGPDARAGFSFRCGDRV